MKCRANWVVFFLLAGAGTPAETASAELIAGLQRFAQRDPIVQRTGIPNRARRLATSVCLRNRCQITEHEPVYIIRPQLEYADGMVLYSYLAAAPQSHLDPQGLSTWCGTVICGCDSGDSGVRVYGDSARARALFPIGDGCVTLLSPPGIFCTAGCAEILDGMAAPGVTVLSHECCHWCDFVDDGVCKSLLGIFPDTCNDRKKDAEPRWGPLPSP